MVQYDNAARRGAITAGFVAVSAVPLMPMAARLMKCVLVASMAITAIPRAARLSATSSASARVRGMLCWNTTTGGAKLGR
jgi:hypothetical protein